MAINWLECSSSLVRARRVLAGTCPPSPLAFQPLNDRENICASCEDCGVRWFLGQEDGEVRHIVPRDTEEYVLSQTPRVEGTAPTGSTATDP